MASEHEWLNAAQVYNAVWVALAFATILLTIVLFAKYGKHSMVLIRYPKVMGLDMFLSSINCILQSFVNTSMFNKPVACQPFMAFADAFDCCSNSVLIGRSVLFYMQAKGMNHMPSNVYLDKIMDLIALLTAPGDYFRLRRQVQSTERTIGGSEKTGSESSALPTWSEKNGFLRLVLVSGCWFVMGWIYSFGSTVGGLGGKAFIFDEVSGNPLNCWAKFVTPYSTTIYVLTVACSACILYGVYSVKDLVGLRNDLVYSLGIGIFFKLLNMLANFMYNVNPNWALVSAYSYSPAALISPIISLSISAYYVFKSSRAGKKGKQARISRKDSSRSVAEDLSNIQKFIDFWATSEGKQAVTRVAARMYALESIRFLNDTENEPVTTEFFRRIFKEYITSGSKWELNIPGAMKIQCQFSLASGETDRMQKSIVEVREEILRMLFPLVRHELRSEESAYELQKKEPEPAATNL